VDAKLARAFANPDPDAGLRGARELARTLQAHHPGAAASIREGLEEMFTVRRLGVSERLARTLTSTNPVWVLSWSPAGRCHPGRFLPVADPDSQSDWRREAVLDSSCRVSPPARGDREPGLKGAWPLNPDLPAPDPACCTLPDHSQQGSRAQAFSWLHSAAWMGGWRWYRAADRCGGCGCDLADGWSLPGW
jgi:hypothetical protein